jgi:hypothetical protein
VVVRNSVFRDSQVGLRAFAGNAATTNATFDVSNAHFSGTATGIQMNGGSGASVLMKGSVHDSTFTGNGDGIAMFAGYALGSATLSLAITRIRVTHGTNGVSVICGSGVNSVRTTVGSSLFADLGNAFQTSGPCAVIATLGDNEAHGNVSNITSTSPSISIVPGTGI